MISQASNKGDNRNQTVNTPPIRQRFALTYLKIAYRLPQEKMEKKVLIGPDTGEGRFAGKKERETLVIPVFNCTLQKASMKCVSP